MISAKLGRKMTLIMFTVVFAIGAVCIDIHLFSGELTISGFGIGGMSAVAPAYVSECSPKEVRGRITGTAQVMVRAFFPSLLGLTGLTVRNRSLLVA